MQPLFQSTVLELLKVPVVVTPVLCSQRQSRSYPQHPSQVEESEGHVSRARGKLKTFRASSTYHLTHFLSPPPLPRHILG